MTLYLLDLNVLQEARPGGNAQVAAWLGTVSDDALRISAATFFEARRGWERERGKRLRAGRDIGDIDAKLAGAAAIEAAYRDRVIPLDPEVMAELARLLGAKDKNLWDTVLAATARVHGLVIVTRNVKDFAGRNVELLDPFATRPVIKRA